jgi:hypothetical protein
MVVAGPRVVMVNASTLTDEEASALLDRWELPLSIWCSHCINGAHGCSGERCDCSCRKTVIPEEDS